MRISCLQDAHSMMPCAALCFGILTLLAGCGGSWAGAPGASPPLVSSVMPADLGVPNSVVTLGDYEFVSVQGTGEIFTYNVSGGSQQLVATPYATPCLEPSGMVIAAIGGANVMAVVCHDTASLVTLTVGADGSLHALGSVSGLGDPYPGIALDGTTVLVPVFGTSLAANGGVAEVSLAAPASPAIVGTATLASPASGGYVNPGYLTVSGGYIFVAAGSESGPLDTSSSVQVVDEATMAVVGQPLVVAHSPQQIAVQGTVAYLTLYDAAELESIDVSDPANLKVLQIVPLAGCHPLPVGVREVFAYVGCYAEGAIYRFNIEDLANMQTMQSVAAIAAPQRLAFGANYLLVPSSVRGGVVYRIDLGAF
jgi:hypothetical protein